MGRGLAGVRLEVGALGVGSGLGQPRSGDLGVGEDHPRDAVVARGTGATEDGIGDDAAVVLGHVREGQDAGDVAQGQIPSVAALDEE